MRRRRRTKFYWLPQYGSANATGEGVTLFSTVRTLALDIEPQAAPFPIVTGFLPIVENFVPNQRDEGGYPLNDIIGNEFVLKRIVGKVFADVRYELSVTENVSLLPDVVASAAFYVADIENDFNDGANVTPRDGIDADRNYNPLNVGLVREPWIWRRSWMLGPGELRTNWIADSGFALNDPTANGGLGVFRGKYPWTNVEYGSVADGPHIDAKTGRRIRQGQQLFFAAAAHQVPIGAQLPDGVAIHVNFALDIRTLGALRRPKNRSDF